MRLNPLLDELRSYPFLALRQAAEDRLAAGRDVIDFGIGEPREETPAFIRDALRDAVTPMSAYPSTEGRPALREAAAGWVARRFGVTLDPATEVLPTLGSKEAIFHLDQVLAPGAVAVTSPGYPVAERAARFAGREVVTLELRAERGFLPDLTTLPGDLALLWLNYPNNPTAATAPLAFYEQAAALAREHDFVLACDEAYAELFFAGDAPVSALQVADRRNVAVLHTLSKRSSMPGYRSGFVAGDPELIAALKRYRPNIGTATPDFVQHAAIAAWADDAHVGDVRAVYRAKRDALLPALQAAGLEQAGGDATFFLWLRAAPGTAEALLEDLGLLVAPGELFGPAGAGFVRVALVPPLADCERAAELLRLSRWRAAPR